MAVGQGLPAYHSDVHSSTQSIFNRKEKLSLSQNVLKLYMFIVLTNPILFAEFKQKHSLM